MSERVGYAEIAAHYRQKIESGILTPGSHMPSMRHVCRKFGVAITTANRAFRALKAEGLTSALPGVGTVVAGPERRAATGEPHMSDQSVPTTVTLRVSARDFDHLARNILWTEDVQRGRIVLDTDAPHNYRPAADPAEWQWTYLFHTTTDRLIASAYLTAIGEPYELAYDTYRADGESDPDHVLAIVTNYRT